MGKKKSGKAPQGRAKQKQKAQNPTPNLSPWTTKPYIRSSDDDEPRVIFRGFAGMTSRTTTPRDPSYRLRHQAIAFVSAGSNTPYEIESNPPEESLIPAIELNDGDSPEDEVLSEESDQEDGDHAATGIYTVSAPGQNDVAMAGGDEIAAKMAEVHMSVESETLQFVVDTVGDASLGDVKQAATQLPIRYAPSPSLSDSEEEVILFQGRNKARVIDDPPTPAFTDTSKPHSLSRTPLTDRPRSTHQVPTASALSAITTAPNSHPSKLSKLEREQQAASQEWTPAPSGAWWRGEQAPQNIADLEKERKTFGGPAFSGPDSITAIAGEDNVAGSTISSLQAELKEALKEKKLHKKATQTEAGPTSANQVGTVTLSRRGKRGRKRGNRLLRDLEIEDEDPEAAAYHDYMENLKSQFYDDEDGSGNAQAQARANSEAHDQDSEINWEDVDIINGNSEDTDDEVIGQDIDDLIDDEDDGLNASDLESSELEEELELAELRFLQHEEKVRENRFRTLTDEQIARLWAKQLELGIEADELVIDNGEAGLTGDYDTDGIGDLGAARTGLAEFTALLPSRSKNQKNAPKRSNRKNNFNFPDASALAESIDQYGHEGFDIMDFERPSLRNTKKSRKGKLPPELDALSDDDLKDTMLDAWDNDRAKKREKKAQREELRAQGMLVAGGKKSKADLGQKYQQGMTIAQVYEELEIFLLDDSMTTRQFPPMDKSDRAALHSVANALNLKSKSVGSGNTRFPVLYKTARTADFDEMTFSRVVKAASRGFLKNQSWSKKGGKGLKASNRAGAGGVGGAMASASLRHGELVGAGAKEIGKENFGHKLMEKMGWTKGMALGKDGEGVLEPVGQMMRIGKAGLG